LGPCRPIPRMASRLPRPASCDVLGCRRGASGAADRPAPQDQPDAPHQASAERPAALRSLRHAHVRLLPPGEAGPVKTLRCQRRLGGCGRLARGAEPIDAFLEAAVFEMVRRPASAQFLARRATAPDQRGALLEQIRAGRGAAAGRTLWAMPRPSRASSGAARPRMSWSLPASTASSAC
jgi:hypothetical protein